LYQSSMDTPMPHTATATAAATASSMNDSNSDLDQKMAAKPEASRPSAEFDPFHYYSEETSSQPASSHSMQGGATDTTAASSPSRPKMAPDNGKGKPGRKMVRKVRGKKAMEDEAGVV
jgi:hypothetical protein